MLLKSRLRPAVRQLLVQRRQELLAEVEQIDDLIREDDMHTLVGMPAFNVHGKVPCVLRRKKRSILSLNH